MKTKSYMYLYIIIYIAFISFVPIISETEINLLDLNDSLKDGIFENQFNIEKETNTYFSYNLTRNKDESYIALTINSPISANIDLKCIISNSDDKNVIFEQFENQENVCPIYKHKNGKIINIIYSMSGYTDGFKLFLKINSEVDITNLNFYIRENGSCQSELKTQKLPNSFAYTAFGFNKDNLPNKQYLLTSSEANNIVIFGRNGREVTQIDETSVISFSNQTLAAHFWGYDRITFFIGRTEKDSENNITNNINIIVTEYNIEKSKLYYYTGNDFYNSYISFHYDCIDEKEEAYLIINYGELSKNDFYFKFHNLIGSKAYFSEFPPGENDITKLEYEETNRFKYLTQTDYHIHAFKFKCSGDGNKIIANIKYNETSNLVDSGETNDRIIKDFNHTFGLSDFQLNYAKANFKEFALEIFTPKVDEVKTFKINFEGEEYEMNNINPKILKIKNKNYNALTVSTNENIETVISVSPSVKGDEDESTTKYFKVHSFIVNSENFYLFYEVEHEFDSNYHIGLEIDNQNNEIIPICYYLSTVSLIQNFGQNCFLIPAMSTKNITIKNIFKISGQENYNIEEPQYTLVIYNNHLKGFNYQIKNLYFETDLPKSTPINNIYKDHGFLFLDTTLKKNDNSFFNLYTPGSEEEKHIDLYVLDDVSNFNKLKFDIKCISAFEVATKFIESLFNEDNNLCYVINEEDYNSNVFHIIYKKTSVDTNERLIIKIYSEEELNIKLVADTEETIRKDFEFSEAIYTLDEPSVYKIYEIDKEYSQDLNNKKVILYNFDDKIEFYGRKENNFKQLYKRNIILFDIDKHDDNFDKYLIVFGRNNCTHYCESKLNYQLKFVENLYYDSIEEFDDFHRFIINIDQCKINEPYIIMFHYGKKPLNKELSLARYIISGDIENNVYIDSFSKNRFDIKEEELKNYQKLKENDLNVNIIKFTCNNNLLSYFDYFTEIDKNDEFHLRKGSIRHFIIKNDTNYTFTYGLIDEIKINLIEKSNEALSIVFENKNMEIKNEDGNTSISLKRTNNDINKFYLAAPETADIPIRITTIINVNSLPKTNIDNLYRVDNKYIYDIPDKAINVTLYIKSANSRLRLLKEEEIEICFNVADFILFEKNKGNCFIMRNSTYELNYTVPDTRENGNKSFIVLYPMDDNQHFDIEKVEPFIDEDKKDEDKKDEGKDDEGKDDEGKDDKDKDDEKGDKEDDKNNNNGNNNNNENKDGGSNWIIIAIIVVLSITLLIIIVFIIFKLVNKRVTSEDIEKDVKQEKPMEIIV